MNSLALMMASYGRGAAQAVRPSGIPSQGHRLMADDPLFLMLASYGGPSRRRAVAAAGDVTPGRLEETASTFPLESYLLAPRQSGAPRRSSWMDGRERALVFFWESPSGRVYLFRTQAPYIVRAIQRTVHAPVDGIFGDITRTAVVADARSRGMNVPNEWPALGPLLGYALSRVLGGGRVMFPPQMEYPDTNRPRRVTSPDGREYTFIGAMDVALGRDVPLVSGPDGSIVPANAADPPAPTPPAPTPPAPTPPAPTPPAPTPPAPGNGSQFVPGPQGNQGSEKPDEPSPSNAPHALVPYGFQGVPGASMFGYIPLVGAQCPKSYIDENGVCKLDAYGIVGGRMLVPGAYGVTADFADPKTYQEADKTPGVMLSLGLLAVSGLIGAATKGFKMNGYRRSRRGR